MSSNIPPLFQRIQSPEKAFQATKAYVFNRPGLLVIAGVTYIVSLILTGKLLLLTGMVMERFWKINKLVLIVCGIVTGTSLLYDAVRILLNRKVQKPREVRAQQKSHQETRTAWCDNTFIVKPLIETYDLATQLIPEIGMMYQAYFGRMKREL